MSRSLTTPTAAGPQVPGRALRRLLAISLLLSGLAALTVGCDQQAPATNGATPQAAAVKQHYRWKMVTSWPTNFPGLGAGAQFVADTIERLSGGRIEIKVYGAGELVGPFEVFDAVSRGTAELGHSGAYYWKGKSPATTFFSTVPFGFTAQEMNAWLYFGGGLELWRELYAGFNLVPFPAGNTGVQMGGWFTRELHTLDDLQGLKIRMPGLGGEVLNRAGATTVNLPVSEIFTALQQGTIDATEWVGPYNDLAAGFQQVASYYYYPGWHEPGSTIELMVNKTLWDELPQDLRAIIDAASRIANQRMLAEFTARNNEALATLVQKDGVQLRQFPPDIMKRLAELSDQVLRDTAAKDPMAGRIFDSYEQFRKQVLPWTAISEQAYMNARDPVTPADTAAPTTP